MTKPVLLCAQRNALLKADGHLLVRGGPGSGKTTIALLKANWEITHVRLAPEQKVLFLSFARVTVARIIEQTRTFVDESARSEMEINTYHGFAWSLIQSYGTRFLLVYSSHLSNFQQLYHRVQGHVFQSS
jgi:DNA helicase II / ATP-dependent DNA helicase PcrA